MSDSTPAQDLIQRFYFSGQPFRGAVVQLQNSFVEALNGHDYPQSVNYLLGEALSAATLMGINLKHNSRISLQARGDASVTLLMAEATMMLDKEQDETAATDHQATHSIRAVARVNADKPVEANTRIEHAYLDLLGHGQLAITIEPEDGERYQGIVSAESHSLKLCLESYFNQSEQIPTCFQFAASSTGAAGILLQRMPHEDSYALDARDRYTNDPKADELWQELVALADTLTDEELLSLPAQEILHRLFHQHPLQLAAAQSVGFKCSCSYERTAAALSHIDPLEIEDILADEGEIVMDCEFCSTRYRFDRDKIAQLQLRSSATRH